MLILLQEVITFSSLSCGGGALLQLQENTPHSRHILGVTGGLGTEVTVSAHSLPFLSRGNSIQLWNSRGSFLFLVCPFSSLQAAPHTVCTSLQAPEQPSPSTLPSF